jgi:RNA polymerase sigma-70 factor (ECF subfamily)
MRKPPDTLEASDLELLRTREPQAVERWFLDHADAVYTFVFYRVGKDEELATDIVQDTFLAALRKIDQYDPKRGAMAAWLTYVARNWIRRALKRKGRYEAYSEFWDQVDQRLLAAWRGIAAAPLPEEVLGQQETTEMVHMALAHIPANYQRALQQRYYQQRPLDEIARAEGMTEGAVKSLLHRARLAFKTAFETLANALDDRSPVGRATR